LEQPVVEASLIRSRISPHERFSVRMALEAQNRDGMDVVDDRRVIARRESRRQGA
jgi:hypothetical protein